MNKTTLAVFFAAAFVFSGCTVHHYHHQARAHKKDKRALHHGDGHDGARHGLPPGHPPVQGMRGHGSMPKDHGKKGHGSMPKGHGMKGRGGLPKGHPHVEGHGGLPKGHPPLDGHSGATQGASEPGEGDAMSNPFAKKDADHAGSDHAEHVAHGPDSMDPAIVAFHDSFAAAWHKEDDASRRTAACAQVAEWKKLAQSVKKLSGGVVFAAATKDLHKQTLAIANACARKTGDVQASLVLAHDALHMLFRVAAKHSTDKGDNLAPGF